MKLSDIAKLLSCGVLVGEDDLLIDIDTVVASDGMSEILAFATPNSLMVTGLTNIQRARTAHVADARAVLYIRGKKPDKNVLAYAREKNIPMLTTELGVFDVCGILHSRGLKGGM